MPLKHLDHFTILCADLARSRAFYSEALGLVDGDRPPFGFPGAWLYLGDRPVVHLVGDRNKENRREAGSVDHVAFAADDLETAKKHFAELRIDFEERRVPGRPLVQLFLKDPDGVAIELNFSES